MRPPALRQTHCRLMACELLYVTVVIEGSQMPPSQPSERGHDIHDVMANYIRACARERIPASWLFFDKLAALKGSEARRILVGMRNNYLVDFEHSLATELTVNLDEQFQPCRGEGRSAYRLTIDHLLGFGDHGKIEDFKSHPSPFEPNSPEEAHQANLYSLAALMLHPEWDEVLFELIFVRYKNCRRALRFTRRQIPDLVAYMQNYRDRQREIHRRHQKMRSAPEATPGNHCQYCPKMANLCCPVAEFNPYANHTPEARLRFNVWAQQLKTQNDQVLQSYVTARDRNVSIRDGNGQVYEYGCWDHEVLPFPLPVVSRELLEWQLETGEDLAGKLVVGATALKRLLKTKKREQLAERISRHVVPLNKPKWGVKKPDGSLEGDDDGNDDDGV